MILSQTDILNLEQHWAVAAVPGTTRAAAFEIAKLRLVKRALGELFALSSEEQDNAEVVLERVAISYELAAIEGLDALVHPNNERESLRLQAQAMAGAYRAYELRQCCKVPSIDEDRIFHVLHLAALAYGGDRWPDLRRWIKDHATAVEAPSVATVTWDKRVLFRLFDCWIRLLRKSSWDDLDRIREIIIGLREDQRSFEAQLLGSDNNPNAQALAFRLIALYHWAKSTELLAVYNLQGQPSNITTELDQHFENARKAAAQSGDIEFEVLLRWLHVAANRMVAGSVWWVAHAVNSRVTRFVNSVTKLRGLFDLLPPQRAAIQEQGLLDQASRAIVVDLPTSGGKTALAQFRILQALNQFDADNGWVAYLAPTRALVGQITRRLRQDFSPLNIRVEQLTGAVEIDGFEESILTNTTNNTSFHVLISTPEKFQLVIRNKKVTRPLALVVIDEAHNIEDVERGLRIELLLATIKRDCASANFLLLMPYVPNASTLASWLGGASGRTISLGTTPWQPNQRIVGLFDKETVTGGRRGDWKLKFETLTTSPNTMTLAGTHQVGPVRPLDISFTQAGVTRQAGAMAKVFCTRGTSIAVAQQIGHVWSMAEEIANNLPELDPKPDEIGLVQRFLSEEISRDFLLVKLLDHGIGVHHAGLSDDARALIEWLAEIGVLKVLCATTTIAQGINFPVSSVFLASNKFPYGVEMPKRAFWNLAGRAGRMDQESIGVVGLAAGTDPNAIRAFVSAATGDLVSRLVTMLDEVEQAGRLNDLTVVINEPQWADFRCYIAHLWSEKRNLDAVLAETEQLLRNTYGFGVLQGVGSESGQRKAQALIVATTAYARKLSEHPENSTLADLTGFAPEGVASALLGLDQLENKLNNAEWQPTSLFSNSGSSALSGLFGVLMKIPQISDSLRELGSNGLNQHRFAEMTQAWVNGKTLDHIAQTYFANEDMTDSISNACKAIYRVLTNSGCWGLAALTKMPTSGINFDTLTEDQKRQINNLPAMIYHGVRTDAAVLMRMNSIPRSIAEACGQKFETSLGTTASGQSVGVARDFIRSLDPTAWQGLVPPNSGMTGTDYQRVWSRLSGETSVEPTARST